MVSGLIMLGGVVMHASPITLGDVTPIARLTGEYEVIVVPAGSPLRSLGDLVAALKADPESIPWGGGSAGGSDQMLAGLVAEAVGVSPRRVNYIAFSGGGESLAAIVGGQVSVGVNGLAELEGQIQAGTVRALAISSASRLPGLDVPTLREQGVPVEFENWRSVVGPPGLSAGQRARLEALVTTVARSRSWAGTAGAVPLDSIAFLRRTTSKGSRPQSNSGCAACWRNSVRDSRPMPCNDREPRAYPWAILLALGVSAAGSWFTRTPGRRRVSSAPAAARPAHPSVRWRQ